MMIDPMSDCWPMMVLETQLLSYIEFCLLIESLKQNLVMQKEEEM